MSIAETPTPIARVQGLGSARHGGGEWVAERVTSVALLLLSAWFIASLLMLPDLGRSTITEWLAMPTGAVPMALFIVTGFIHGLHGLKVVVDDYVHDDGNRFALNTFLLFAAVAGASLSLFALAKIAFGADA